MDTSKEYKIVDAVSMAASFVSDQFNVLNFRLYGIQITATGSPNGTFKIQESNDELGIASTSSSWDDLANSSTAIAAAGTIYFKIKDVTCGKIRLVYTYSSGSGSCTAKIIGKN